MSGVGLPRRAGYLYTAVVAIPVSLEEIRRLSVAQADRCHAALEK